ncbi:VWA domain-containing protein [Persephonella atlantica]|uniref:VWA domain-containing protein n=1 Tax=Persephonella atlantica TaxID=2699429 RepID=A0ABS1GFE8_9AQUI|nr:VWA domain-containing protein [Persephonella atlantica]MBK3331610.1 VWA domain-containing protein [Persephonella atlantica]
MLELLNKEYLWLILPVLLTGIFLIRTGQFRRVEVVVVFIVVLLIVFSLSRPVINRGEKVFYKKDTEILIMIDHSLSMGAKDIKPDRLRFSIEKAVNLVEELKWEKVGLLVFSDRPEIITFPYEKAEKTLKILKSIKIKPTGSTDILSAFSMANSILTGKERIIVLFSDGSDEDLGKVEELIKQSGIKLVFYGTASKKGGKIPGYNALSKLNMHMVKIAQNSGMFVRPTEDNSDIRKIYHYINQISEKTKAVLLKIPSKMELSPFIAGFSLLIILSGYMVRRFLLSFFILLLINPITYGGELKGIFYYITGNYKNAAQEFLEDKKPENMYNAALLYYKAGMYSKALSILKEIKTEKLPLIKKIKYTQALCYLAQKNYRQARKISEDLISIFPQEKRIKKLYLFTNFILSMEEKKEDRKTIVKIREKMSQTFKTSPAQIGEKNPW